MESLRNWIRKHGTLKQFLISIQMSKSFFCEWETGKKRLSLQKASKIVYRTNGEISFDDLVKYELSFEKNGDSK